MFGSENLLAIPQDKFGLAGIHIGNLVSQELVKQSKGLKAQYNPSTNKITILNTSDLPPSILNKILYECPASREYDQYMWYPVIEEERNKEGNLEFGFSYLKPGSDTSGRNSSRFGSGSIMEPMSGMLSLQFFGMSSNIRSPFAFQQTSFTPFAVEVEEEAVSKKEVEKVEKAISTGVVDTMSQFFNKHEMLKGVWYPNDYSKYLMNEFDIEMNPSFFTGFASEEFFEKTGRFTFQLKEGKKASEAILSFLNGPTVADCGNATMVCYYKCILDIVGEEKFNHLFGSSSAFELIIGQNGITDEKSPISDLAEFTEASKQMKKGVLGKRPLHVGEECYFDGVIWYANKHPEGFGGGWNVIYIGDNIERDQLFMAHGFEKPLTEKEINQKFIELYNRERTPQDEQHVSEANKPRLYDKKTNGYLKEHYTISDEVENSDKLKGFLVGSVRGLNAKELVRLKNSENVDEFMLKLRNKKISSFSSSIFF